MHKAVLRVPGILRQLESLYGNQAPCWPTDPYHFLVWWHCGYPASDAACAKGWEALDREVGVEPRQLLAAGAGDDSTTVIDHEERMKMLCHSIRRKSRIG